MDFDLNKKHCYYFNEMCKIPHGSYNEKQISNYLVEFAKEHNLKYMQDDMYNVIIYKKASKGYENAAPLLLQAHTDMVCEANKATKHDFEKDPLNLYVEDGWLHAKGTTLGADDGVGCAYMLAILDDDNLEHGDLECAFTVQEEVGLFGAMHLKGEDIKSRRMISLDGGGETSTLLSSAGGCLVESNIECKYIDNEDETYSIFITGLSGGHSGGEINKEKGNSNKILSRILKEMSLNNKEYNLVSIEGGSKDNAIPREAEAIITSKMDLFSLSEAMSKTVDDVKTELEFSDPNFKVEVKSINKADKKMDKESTEKVITYMYLLPDGFRHRSMAIEGLTLTSLNMGIVRTKDDKVVITESLRSALDSGISHLIETIKVLADLFNIETKTSAYYPGWNYSKESNMRDILAKEVKKQYDKDLVVIAAHGGCECGVFKAMHEDMDIISMGPITRDIHTPEERLDLESFDRAYKLLCSVVSACKE